MRLRVRKGDFIGVTYIASAAPTSIRSEFDIVYDDGSSGTIGQTIGPTFTTDRTAVATGGGEMAPGDGTIVSGRVGHSGTIKRGQLFVVVDMFRGTRDASRAMTQLCKGYVYDGNSVPFGQYVESTPAGGDGYLSWVTVASNVAGNSATTFVLGVTNTIRVYRSIVLYYNSDGTAATRTVTFDIRRPGSGATPTGFTGGATVFASPTVTLTATEEGVLYLAESGAFMSANDAGTLTVSNNTTAPYPLPYTATEGDLGDINTNIGTGQAGDVYSIFALTEEWLVL